MRAIYVRVSKENPDHPDNMLVFSDGSIIRNKEAYDYVVNAIDKNTYLNPYYGKEPPKLPVLALVNKWHWYDTV